MINVANPTLVIVAVLEAQVHAASPAEDNDLLVTQAHKPLSQQLSDPLTAVEHIKI